MKFENHKKVLKLGGNPAINFTEKYFKSYIFLLSEELFKIIKSKMVIKQFSCILSV